MRRLILATTLFLAGCATAPQQAPAPQQPVQRAPTQTQPTVLTGLSPRELVGRLGAPALQIHEGTSLKLQFRSNYCVLDAYLYPGRNGALQVTHVDARRPSGADIDQNICISELQRRS